MTHASVPADQRELLGISDTAVSCDYLLKLLIYKKNVIRKT